MARNLLCAIEDAFYGNTYTRCHSYRFRGTPRSDARKFIDVPIYEDTFEVPLLAFDTFKGIALKSKEEREDIIAVCLNDIGAVSSYATLDRNMRDVLEESFSSTRLAAVEVKQGDNTILYYSTCGAVFNKDMETLMMMSYQIKTCNQEDGHMPAYKIVKPILRIDPNVFLSKADPMERYIINKILTASLSIGLWESRMYLSSSIVFAEGYLKVKVELDKSPFVIHQACVPSISTTNQSLLQVALDHIDEIIR